MDGREIPNNSDYRKILHLDGTRITLGDNRFELSAVQGNEINEQQSVQKLREWLRWRKEQEIVRIARALSR